MFKYRQNIPHNNSITQIEHFFKWLEEYECYDMNDTQIIKDVKKLPIKGSVTVQDNEVGRFDLLSYRIYGDVRFWWLLMLYNGMLTTDEATNGKIINYFDIDSFFNLIHDYLSSRRK